MKKIWFLFIFGFIATAWSQPNAEKPVREQLREQLIEKKLNYLREKMLLSDEEFKAFSKEFRTYEKNRWQLFNKKRELLQSLQGDEAARLSDREVYDRLTQLRKIERNLFDLKENHFDRVEKILPPRKVLAYWRYSMHFNKMLLHRRQGKGKGHPSWLKGYFQNKQKQTR